MICEKSIFDEYLSMVKPLAFVPLLGWRKKLFFIKKAFLRARPILLTTIYFTNVVVKF